MFSQTSFLCFGWHFKTFLFNHFKTAKGIASSFTVSSVFPKDSMSSVTRSNRNISIQNYLVKTWKPGSRTVNLICIFYKLGSFLWKYFTGSFPGNSIPPTRHPPQERHPAGQTSLRERASARPRSRPSGRHSWEGQVPKRGTACNTPSEMEQLRSTLASLCLGGGDSTTDGKRG